MWNSITVMEWNDIQGWLILTRDLVMRTLETYNVHKLFSKKQSNCTNIQNLFTNE
jgi:hypothetical protein